MRSVLIPFVAALAAVIAGAAGADPLPSWNDRPAKRRIIEFVEKVSRPGSPDHVRVEERIATFDNDGTLWVEQPAYTQAFFVADRVKALAAVNPALAEQAPFRDVVAQGVKGLAALDEHGVARVVGFTHAGMEPSEFRAVAAKWLNEARHPKYQRPFASLTYGPMIEVLRYFEANGFRNYIVSGGGVEFIRAVSEALYGIPPERVIGSRIKLKFREQGGRAVLMREAALDFIDDKEGKPIAIEQTIGRRPIAAFGNSDGDLQMLQWTTQGGGPRLGVIVRHTDAEREFAYDRNSPVGRLDKALDLAGPSGWTVVDMKADWKTVFAHEKP